MWRRFASLIVRTARPRKRGLDAVDARAAAAGSAERALVAPLGPGAPLEDFEVQSISIVKRGVVIIVCSREERSIRLYIALEGGPVPAAATAGRYAVFYSTGDASGFRDPDGERLSKALAAVIANHRDLPPPRGLTRFPTNQSNQRGTK